jgi:YD repeat-containing protein
VKTSGSRTYPVAYTFDHAGRMKTMKTWQTAGGDATAATTTWNYHTQRGWLTNKTYQGAAGPRYSYTPAGRLYSRTWARGTNATYLTNAFGDTVRIAYSDGSPGVTNGFDRLGRLVASTNGPNIVSRTYMLPTFLASYEGPNWHRTSFELLAALPS